MSYHDEMNHRHHWDRLISELENENACTYRVVPLGGPALINESSHSTVIGAKIFMVRTTVGRYRLVISKKAFVIRFGA